MVDTPSLTLVRRIKASPAKIYAALTSPEQLARWWRPDAGPVLKAEVDVRVGGRFRIVFRTQDGAEHSSRGEYREVVPNQRLVFTWESESHREQVSIVTIALRSIAEGTELTLTHAGFADTAERDEHRDGWNGAFDHLETLFKPTEYPNR